MPASSCQERIDIHRFLIFVRLGLSPVALSLLFFAGTCERRFVALLLALLLALVYAPTLVYLLRRNWLDHPAAAQSLVTFDFVLVSLLCLFSVQQTAAPIFFPLYFFLVSVEASVWWGWPGSVVSGALAATALIGMYALGTPGIVHESPLALACLVLMGAVVAGYFAQWGLGRWRARRHMAGWLHQQEDVVRQIHEQLNGWQRVCQSLQAAESPHDLLETALREAQKLTASPVGLAVLRDPYTHVLRAECWEGFALPGAEQTSLAPGNRLPHPSGQGWVNLQHVLSMPLPWADPPPNGQGPPDAGHIVVSRLAGPPYRPGDERWLEILSSYTAALLENRFLRQRLGRIQQQADSVLQAGWTLTALPDPAAAMEIACRDILSTLRLDQVSIFLYGQEYAPGCQVVVYSADEPARTTTMALQGRGLRLLRRFLDSGSPMIINRKPEWPEIFDLMDWAGVQAMACFPLYVLGHCWGALCVLAEAADAFPPETQQSLAIFSGEVALALENLYLRRTVAGTEARP